MSILRKVPKIEQVLDNMSLESLKRLESLMNSGNGATETYTLFGGENKLNYENKDLGVWYCNIELERNKSVETGFLIWESTTKALFISYDITQCLKEYEIDLTTYTYVKINEKLSIEEFRRVLEDNINKEVVHIDTSGNVEIGKNLVVDGKVILNGKQDLVDTSGNELIPSGGGDIWLDITPYVSEDRSSISQEGFDLVWNSFYKENENSNFKYAGILYFDGLFFYYKGFLIEDITNGILFEVYGVGGGDSGLIYQLAIRSNNSVSLNIIGKNNLFLPIENPTSQVIPSITTSNEQQNLTIGDGLAIENGVLKTTGSGGSGFNLFDNLFVLGGENVNFDTLTLTEIGLTSLNNMYASGKLLGITDGEPSPTANYMSVMTLKNFTDNTYYFSNIFWKDNSLQFAQFTINKTTGAIEMVQKVITATDPA